MGPLHGILDTAIAADAGTHHIVGQAAHNTINNLPPLMAMTAGSWIPSYDNT